MNTKIWKVYTESDSYRRLIGAFNVENRGESESLSAMARIAGELNVDYTAADFLAWIRELQVVFPQYEALFEGAPDREKYEEFVDRLVFNDYEGEMTPDKYRRKNSCWCFFSPFFYLKNRYFKPVLYPAEFYKFFKACEVLEIDLPECPNGRKYKETMMWYYDLCGALEAFRLKYGLTDAELCAALYGLAPIMVEDEPEKPLPKPVSVWFTGADKEDYPYLEALDENYTLWACNRDTRRGDIIVIYVTSPYCHIHSIWRADSEGVFNPFDKYQNRSRVTKGVKIPPISLSDMKKDDVFKTLPMLNNNLQGLNGKMLPPDYYRALRRMIEEKGGDISSVPELYKPSSWTVPVIKKEEDVEDKILIPFLKEELGYVESDWARRWSIKSGRKESSIPDFAIFKYGEAHAESAPFVIEVKEFMANPKETWDNFRQGRAYAKIMESNYMAICDKEMFVLYYRKTGGQFNYAEPLVKEHWANIYGDIEIHAKIVSHISAEVLRSALKKK